MKKFTKQEIMELYAKVMMDEMTFSQMTKVLNERVSEEDKPNFKDGDFVVNVCGVVIIFKNKVGSYIYEHAYFSELAGVISFSNLPTLSPIKRYATEEEKKKMLDVLEKKGKRWNEEKLCIENMQVRKFKIGDKVRIKHGVSSKTHDSIRPYFAYSMDKLIGKELTVEYCDNSEIIICDGYSFLKEWLEPYEGLKNGDFVVGFGCVIILHKQIDEYSAQYHVLYAKTNGMLWYGRIYWQTENINKLRLATETEKQELIDTLTKEGKRWNEEKKCIEDIPKPKFKSGDKVRIKEGISSKTYSNVGPAFVWEMDDLIGETMTVDRYTDYYVECEGMYWYFLEEWLEPYVELKKGDLAIFWDSDKGSAFIGEYDCFKKDADYPHTDNRGDVWANAIKFESIGQYRKLLKGEI